MAENIVIGRCVLSLQEWKSVKNKEDRLLLTPDGPSKGRTKVRVCFPLLMLCFYLNM